MVESTQQSSTTPSLHLGFLGLWKIVACSQPWAENHSQTMIRYLKRLTSPIFVRVKAFPMYMYGGIGAIPTYRLSDYDLACGVIIQCSYNIIIRLVVQCTCKIQCMHAHIYTCTCMTFCLCVQCHAFCSLSWVCSLTSISYTLLGVWSLIMFLSTSSSENSDCAVQ